jgi:hypothetical protein
MRSTTRFGLFLTLVAACGSAAFGITSGCSSTEESTGAGNAGAATHTGGAAGSGAHTGAAAGQGGGANGGSGGGGSGCNGVTCSGLGTCVLQDGSPVCNCNPGYHDVGLTCVVDETCDGVAVGRCATCEVIDGIAQLTCPDGLVLQGIDCVPSPNPCDTTTCNDNEYCVPEAHCAPLGACVPTCDCSNCPNCTADNSDGKWNDWQEYCGAQPDQSPATMACNIPCPPGDGCLPYQTQICWPMEGCFSL